MSPEEFARKKNKLEAFEVNSPDALKAIIQGQLQELQKFALEHSEAIDESFQANISELESRTTNLIQRTDNLQVLRKLLSSVHVIQNDLEDHVRPNIK